MQRDDSETNSGYSSSDKKRYYSRRENYDDEYNDRRYQDQNYKRYRDTNGYSSNFNSYETIPDLEYITRTEQYKKPVFIKDNAKRYRDNFRPFSSQFKDKHIPAEPNNTIGVFGFGPYTTDEDIKNLLKDKLKNINEYTYKLITDDRTGLCKGFCFVDFKCLEDAINAKDILSFESFRGQDFKCDFSYKQGIMGESQSNKT